MLKTLMAVPTALITCALVFSCGGDSGTVNGNDGPPGAQPPGNGNMAGVPGAPMAGGAAPPGVGGAPGSQPAAGGASGSTLPPAAGATGEAGGAPPDVFDGGTLDDGGSSVIDPPPDTAGAGGSTQPPPPTGPGCLQGSGDYVAKGPYGVATMDVTIGASGPYTIYYPDPFDATCPHPIVAWGNGTAAPHTVYAFYNEHAASWGMVVAASHNTNVGSGQFHIDALDYLLAENNNAGSIFNGRLSTRAGTSGHSQGGMGANIGAGHPNVEAEVNVQGAFGSAPAGVAFICLTGTQDIATQGCKTSVDGTASPALYANWNGGTHTGTATLAGYIGGDQGTIQYMRFYSAWFRCFLADDQTACAMFQGGATCPVCTEPGWAEIYARNF